MATSLFVSCEDAFRDDLPGANSQADTIFPDANFSYASSQDDFRIVNFTDLSSEASKFSWDFGFGGTSTERDPSFTFPAAGSYPVTLTASDGNDVTSSITIDVDVIDQLVPIFDCADFNCSPRTPWAGVDRGTTSSYSGSSSPTPPEGNGGAKISSSSQFLDQTILVSSDTEYEIVFWYVSSNVNGASAGRLLIEDADNGDDFRNEDIPVTNQTSAYVETTYRFKTGPATENMRFNIEYGGTEVRVSKISIERI